MTKRAARTSLSQELRAQFAELVELGPGEPTLLDLACRRLDELERLEGALRAAEDVVEGSTGQPKVNSLYEEIRRHTATIQGLLKQLSPPAESSRVDLGAAMSEVAHRRWHGPRVVR